MIPIIKSKLFEDKGFTNHGFTAGHVNFSLSKECDTAAALKNLTLLRKQIGLSIPLARLVQVHGAKVLNSDDIIAKENDNWAKEPVKEGDAIVSGENPAVLAVQTADCVPILLASPQSKKVAVIHAGWRGLSRGIVLSTVRSILQPGENAIDLIAAIGPCICSNCYITGDDVASLFPESAESIGGESSGLYNVDLPLAAEVSLIGAGLSTRGIDRLDICTSCGEHSLFSHRKSKGDCGRQLSFICS
jgi:YfiH family protein